MYLMGEDIVVSEPNACRVEEALNEIDILMVTNLPMRACRAGIPEPLQGA